MPNTAGNVVAVAETLGGCPQSGTAAGKGRVGMIELSASKEHALVRVHGNIDKSLAPSLRDGLSWATDHHIGVVVDLAGASLIDPVGLGVLVRARSRARHRGTVLCLVAPSRYLMTVLHTMRVDVLFPTFPDCGSAFSWLRCGDPATPPALAPAAADAGS